MHLFASRVHRFLRSEDGPTAVEYAVMLALIIAFPFIASDYQVGLMTQFLTFGLLAMSLDLLGDRAGLVSFGHGAWFGLGY